MYLKELLEINSFCTSKSKISTFKICFATTHDPFRILYLPSKIVYRMDGFKMGFTDFLLICIKNNQICFKNTYLKDKNSHHTIQISSFEYLFTDWLKKCRLWNIAQLWKFFCTAHGGFWTFHSGIMFLHY